MTKNKFSVSLEIDRIGLPHFQRPGRKRRIISLADRTNVTCQTGEVCATIIGSAAKHDVIQKKGCVAREKCNTTSTETYVGVNYTTRYKCCEGNACNSAPTLSSAHLSLAMVLAMLGFWCTQLL
uniref:Uncharacterized protein n=1 Tax=Sphaerodactylus townsendi TaxID=933632 RepID=A0ACB8EG77_9SAUR